VEKIMRESREALNPGGAALVYQFTRASFALPEEPFSPD
jgi:hypothetical protein